MNTDNQQMLIEILTLLQGEVRFYKQDILNKYSAYPERDVELALWEARESIRRTDGVVFGVTPGHPGLYSRLESEGIAKQARSQRRAGTKKIRRALEKTDLAATQTNVAADKERLEKEADRQRLRLAIGKRKSKLPGLEDT